jgi:phosphocarrier protein
MRKKEIIIHNKSGIHVRIAAQVSNLCEKFNSKIFITHENANYDMKSIISLMQAYIPEGSLVTVTAEGVDENEAMEALVMLINKLN